MLVTKSILKRCPHCGGSARLHGNYGYRIRKWFVFVKCDICGSQGKGFTSEEEPSTVDWSNDSCERAVEVWNMRTPSEEK